MGKDVCPKCLNKVRMSLNKLIISRGSLNTLPEMVCFLLTSKYPFQTSPVTNGRGAYGVCSGVVPLRGYNLKGHRDHYRDILIC